MDNNDGTLLNPSYTKKSPPKISEKLEKRVCTCCGEEKYFSEFPIDKNRRDGIREQCKICRRKCKALWKLNNPDKVKASRNGWLVRNPTYRKNYVQNNPEKIKEIRKRSFLKVRNLPKNRLHVRIHRGVYNSLKGNKGGVPWEQLVGYTAEKLRKHLQRKFLPGMSWDNMGEWHIDHKIPVSAFNFSTPNDIDFKKCWALKNLQPLWGPDNVAKGAKLFKPHQPALISGL